MGTPMSLRGKVPLSIITIIIFVLALVVLLYTERISSFSSSAIFRFKPCARRNAGEKSVADDRNVDISALNYAADDRFEFDPDECSLTHGKWVFNRSIKPLYSDRTCPYLDRQVQCVKNGRPDSDYRHWEWQPNDCSCLGHLVQFDPKIALRKLQGKRLMFVGDSLQRGQWQSFVCLVESVIPEGQKSMKRAEYDATVEFYWAPFLVESNSDLHIVADPKKRILKVDSVASIIGRTVSYTLGLKTWANWVDSNVNPNRTRVFFTTMSPTHQRSADWGNANGTKCFNETKPITKKRHWGSGSDKRMMSVVAGVVKRMKVPVTQINITQLSEFRIDAHTSVYTELGGKLLTDEEKEDPLHYADCIHWCLPGVPDTWNQILYAHLL
ncbi:hypothetical protein Pfo_028061 [Paulownia fortunei]|nr:hypothetical protein Pfo_028061 [Paulownia fortunei]